MADVGFRFNIDATRDVCLPGQCTNRVQDGGESAIDCGGPCGPCTCDRQDAIPGTECTPSCPCALDEGDCDTGLDCLAGFCVESGLIDRCRDRDCWDRPDGTECPSGSCRANVCVVAPFHCGNSTQDPGEQCDDGNMVDGDGCNSGCVLTPGAYITGDDSGALGFTRTWVNGALKTSYRWRSGNQRVPVINDFGAGVRIRQANATGGAGDEYTPQGTPTGVANNLDLNGGTISDAAYDPGRNAMVVLRSDNAQVVRYGPNFESPPQVLFTADAGDLGIAYDPKRDRIWTSNWNASTGQVVEWTITGLRLRAFDAEDARNAGLAFDQRDDTLWMYTGGNQIKHYRVPDRLGFVVGLPFPNPTGQSLFGADMLLVPSECGDGDPTDPGEQCDDGNHNDSDGCESDCTLPFCGNAIQDPGEQCDDGDVVIGDGCNPGCVLTPGLYITGDFNPGLGFTRSWANGGFQYPAYRWRRANQRVPVIADFGAGIRIRQASATGGAGDEYTPEGTPTGLTSNLDLNGGSTFDATWDPNRNVIYVLRRDNDQVVRYGPNFEGPGVTLFTADSGDVGIAYDPKRDRIWTSNWNASTGQVVEWSITGERLRAFTAQDARNAGLAFDQRDDSLWMYTSSDRIKHYSRLGAHLGTPSVSPCGQQMLGGDMLLVASQCGDGDPTDPGEQCDDGNHVDGDGCESDCTLP